LLLLRERFAKSLFGPVDVAQVPFPIDEGVDRVLSRTALAPLAVHIEELRVRAEEDVGGQAPQRGKAALEVRANSRIGFGLYQGYEREQREAADVDGEQLAIAVAYGE